MEEAANSEDELTTILNFSVDEASKYAREQGTKPERMVVVISSVNLEADIKLTIQKINEDSVNTIKNRFIEVDQSNTLKDRGSLYGAPFKVDITVLPPRGTIFPVVKRKTKGARPYKVKQCLHNIDLDSVYTIDNDDSYCLFRAIELLRIKTIMCSRRFSEYLYNRRAQTDDVLRLLQELNIPLNEDGYDVETYAPILQEYYTTKFPGVFKIFFFGDVGYYKPFFKTNPAEFITPLCVYYANNHFMAIKNINTFFSIRNYCFHCEKPYNRDVNHLMSCRARCVMCCEVGKGSCNEVVDYERWCDGCHKTFKNENCYNVHLKYGACNESKYCEKCGKIYRIKYGERSKKKNHVCFWKYCR